MQENPEFLKKKYGLHNAPEVKSVVLRTEKLTGKKVSRSENQNKEEADIQNYLDRLEKLILDPEHKQLKKKMGDKEGTERSHIVAILREKIMNKYVRPNKNKLAEGARMVEERAATQQGIDMQYNEEQLEERGEIAVKDLESSLDQWIKYLSDLNEPYPSWFRYYVFRNILELGEYDKDKQEFPKRTAGTNRLFPDVDRGALAHIQEVIEASKDKETLERIKKAQQLTDTPAEQLFTKEKAKAFADMTFAKQYAESIKEAGDITPEMRAETRGKWIKYSQDSDPTALWASLQNKGTAWCTKGFATAETQLKGGDFYVYYTLDKQNEPKIPRIAIRMQGGSISEVRGVADSQQNLEGNMTEIAEGKMNELPGKEKYKKASADMKFMTNIYNKSFKIDKETKEKTYIKADLIKEELIFLYEINGKINGFGYKPDPRIQELRSKRNTTEDACIVLDCNKGQIATNIHEVNENTKAYIGPLEKGIFEKLPSMEYVYTSFPDKRVQPIEIKSNIEYPKTKDAWLKAYNEKDISLEGGTEEMLEKMEQTTLLENQKFVRLTVADLGFDSTTEYKKICAKAESLGLELCAQDDGPKLRLSYDQPTGDYIITAMKSIEVSGGNLRLWDLLRRDDGESELYWNDGKPDSRWDAGSRFVFRLRK